MDIVTMHLRSLKDTAKKLKILAAQNDISMGQMLDLLIEKYNESEKENEDGTT